MFVGSKTASMKAAREREFKVQCRKAQGGSVTLGEDSFDAITLNTFRAIESKPAGDRSGVEQEVFSMGREAFSTAARVPIKTWWYQSGNDTGSGKLKREFLSERTTEAEKRGKCAASVPEPAVAAAAAAAAALPRTSC
jgi:hypothetical protein